MSKKKYRTVFVSDIHLGNVKNQSDKLLKFLNSISFENLIIIGDFIDYRQLSRFGKWQEKDVKALGYINNLAKNGVKVTYIQGNHDRKLKCGDKIYVENMSIIRDMYYKTNKGKVYYITHGDCMDGINKNGNNMGQIGSIFSGLLLKVEYLWNKNVYGCSCVSIVEKLDGIIKKCRMPEGKIQKKIRKFAKNLNCDGIILGHFHVARHYEIDGLDYFNTGERLRLCSAVIEDENGDLELIHYK